MIPFRFLRSVVPLLGALAAFPAAADPVTPFHFDGATAPTGLKDHTEYLIDPDGEETLETVRQRDDWRPAPRANLGYIARPVWSRTTLVNASDEARLFILHKVRPGVARVDAHFIHLDGRRTHHALGVLRPHEGQRLWHRYVAVSETLEARERVTLYTRVHTPGPLEATWWFSSVGDFSTHSTVEHLVWGLFAGAVLTMVIYNLMLWFSLRERILLVYAVFGILLLQVGYSVQGFYRLFDFGLPHIWHVYSSWFFGGLFHAAMIVLGMVFFDTRQTMPRMHRWLQFLLAMFVFYLAWQFAATRNWEWFALSPWMYHLFTVTYISLMATAFRGFRLGLIGSGYYMAGQGFIFLATLLGSLALTGHISPSLGSLLSLPVGGLLDIAFLSKAISLRIGLLKAELERQRESTVAQSRFASIGKTVGMVTHQWRTPLARQGAMLTELETLLENEDDPALLDRLRRELLPRLQQNLELLNTTVSDFRTFFAADTQNRRFSPAETVDETLALLDWQTLPENVRVDWRRPASAPETLGHPATLAHVLIILVENALDIFAERRVADPELTLELTTTDRELRLTVSDNGGGIDTRPIDRIFTTFVSGKRRESSGMGLYVARMLVTERLGGRLVAENAGEGARFTVILPRVEGMG